jgi:hypothetical protein
MHIKLSGVVAGVLALVALTALPATASAGPVELKEVGGAVGLPVGAPLLGTSANVVFEANNGLRIECAKSFIEAELIKNPGANVKIKVARFEGAGGGACATNAVGLTATVISKKLPWEMTFSEVGGLGVSVIAGLEVEVEVIPLGLVCKYGGNVLDEFPFAAPIGDTIPGSVLALKAGGALCPGAALITGEFTITAGGVGVEA